MATLRKAVLATAMLSTGLLTSTGMAFADQDTTSTDDGATYQHGLVNSQDVSPNTNPDLCNNQVPVNVLGVQVPIQDLAAGIPLLSHSDDGNGSPSNVKGCSNPASS